MGLLTEMGIAILNELQERLHNCAIAGVGLAGEDFRLRRTVEALEGMAGSSPILKKILQLVKPVLSPDTQDRAQALLDAINLVDAVICTQADFLVEGEIAPVAVSEGETEASARYSELYPLYTALTTKGSGRYELIETAWKEESLALRDFRLKPALIGALADTYSEIADLAEKILRAEDMRVIPLLKNGFDPQGKREMVRRLQIMEAVAGAGENDFYLALAMDSGAAVREEAIHALRFDEGNIPYLLELAATERGKMKEAAYTALSTLNTKEVNDFWLTQMGKGKKKPSPKLFFYLRGNSSDEISDLVAGYLEEELERLNLHPSAQPLPAEECEQLCALLPAILHKSSRRLTDVLEAYGRQEERLAKLRREGRGRGRMPLGAMDIHTMPSYGEEDYQPVRLINCLLIEGIADGRNPGVADMVRELFRRCGSPYLSAYFASELLEHPETSYDQFHSLFKGDTARRLELTLGYLRYYRKEKGFYYFIYRSGVPTVLRRVTEKLDIRWYRLLTGQGGGLLRLLGQWTGGYEVSGTLLSNLINPDDPESLSLLQTHFRKEAETGRSLGYLQNLKLCGETDFSGLVLKYLIQEKSLGNYQILSAYQRFPTPRQTQIAELEELYRVVEKRGQSQRNGSTLLTFLRRTIDELKQG